MAEFLIGKRLIGDDHEPVVIAEIGINHEGSLDAAIQMADAAIDAGAEIVKHQTHVVEDEMSDEAKSVVPGNADVSIYEIMARCALGEDDERKLKQHVQSRGAIFISTPFSRAAADRLTAFGVAAYKIGSGECNNYPLVKHVARARQADHPEHGHEHGRVGAALGGHPAQGGRALCAASLHERLSDAAGAGAAGCDATAARGLPRRRDRLVGPHC